MLLPKQDRIVIPIEKLTKYALDTVRELDKAIAFREALSFTETDAGLLAEKIRLGVSMFTAAPNAKDRWGQRYQVIIKMTGNESKCANVLMGWIDDEAAGEMRLISVYVTKKEVCQNDKGKTV